MTRLSVDGHAVSRASELLNTLISSGTMDLCNPEGLSINVAEGE